MSMTKIDDAGSFVGALLDVFEAGSIDDNNGLSEVQSSRTFEDAMLLTSDTGIVVRMTDGSEYQVTIVQSKGPRA